LPLLVGGTGQYVRAVRDGWSPPGVPPNARLREVLAEKASARGADWLHAKLAQIDPAAATLIDARNIRRTVRALEVILISGRRFSEQRVCGAISYRFLTVGLRLARADLYSRIDARIDEMLRRGLLDETRQLLLSGYASSLPSFSAIGYQQCARVLAGDISLDEARLDMRRATRSLVRRQANWFKDSDSDITWFDADRPDLVHAIAALIRGASSVVGAEA
jgi:tRNA dimethylallyltransferase